MNLSSPPKLLLGVTGGIAAYKAAELVRLFIKAGWQVQVVMTAHAAEFITPLTFQALTGRETRGALFDPQHEAAMGHIELARWPDAILIAPATANTLAKLAQGMADDLLSTLCLATDKPLFVAPAMNRLMWAHAATQANIATLQKRGVVTLGPGSGAQACGETGDGRLMEPEEIFKAIEAAQSRASPIPHLLPPIPASDLSGLHAVVTAGPTREPLDPVRFITSRSSGKQGYAVAAALVARGARVTLISGPTQLDTPAGLTRIDVESVEQMLGMSLAVAAEAQIFIGAAATADYRATHIAPEKIKKSGESMSLMLTKNPDVLARVREALPKLFMVEFTAETENLAEHAQTLLARKQLDLVAANSIADGKGFGADDNALSLFWQGGSAEIATAPKAETARALVEHITTLYRSKKP
ncbi:MAG: bifunctional phosphopantothenoylcysteine decarboxylase/phosphopantothenate--cysteine ligase CoaBC [Stagnimonas sp.]|nr:bifunctional phosphopantothenoylcysteine decarboxylase/phosphopantothenate--cysteine ligase CoaBC [Stagnimonas sp.]